MGKTAREKRPSGEPPPGAGDVADPVAADAASKAPATGEPEPLERARLQAEVAKQRLRIAKEELKRARKRVKEAKREAKRARKLSGAARKAWKRARKAHRGNSTPAASTAQARRRSHAAPRKSARRRGALHTSSRG